MGYNKITNLLGKLDKDEIPKFKTIKWIEIFDQSNGTWVILMMDILFLLVKLLQQILGMMLINIIKKFL